MTGYPPHHLLLAQLCRATYFIVLLWTAMPSSLASSEEAIWVDTDALSTVMNPCNIGAKLTIATPFSTGQTPD